jgi:hypothetical protein
MMTILSQPSHPPPTTREDCQDDAPSLTVELQPSQDEQPASSHAESQTHTVRHSLTILGAVERYVGSPLIDSNVQILTIYKPGTTEQPTPPDCQDDHPVMRTSSMKPGPTIPTIP